MESESQFKHRLIQKVYEIDPEIIVLKNDPNYIQAIPDLIFIKGRKCLVVETKKHKDASFRPNQKYYIEKMHGIAAYPENMKEVLDEVQRTFRSKR